MTLAPIDLKIIAQLECNAVPPLVKFQDLKLKIQRQRCLEMYPVRVSTWWKVLYSHEDFVMRKLLTDKNNSTLPQGCRNDESEGRGRWKRCLVMKRGVGFGMIGMMTVHVAHWISRCAP